MPTALTSISTLSKPMSTWSGLEKRSNKNQFLNNCVQWFSQLQEEEEQPKDALRYCKTCPSLTFDLTKFKSSVRTKTTLNMQNQFMSSTSTPRMLWFPVMFLWNLTSKITINILVSIKTFSMRDFCPTSLHCSIAFIGTIPARSILRTNIWGNWQSHKDWDWLGSVMYTFCLLKVSCDLNGSIECLKQYTQPEKPFFYFDSLKEE